MTLRPKPRGTQMFDAVGFGLNMTDILAVVDSHPSPGSKVPLQAVRIRPGGQAATAMTAVHRLGWTARYVGRFGDDPHGVAGRASLERAGVDVSASTTVPGATNGLSIILVDRTSGQRTVMWSRHAGLKMTARDVDPVAVCAGRVLLVDCHETAAATAAARAARAAHIPTVIDVEHVRPGIADLLREIDILIAAQEFPMQYTGIGDPGAALRALAHEYRPAVACATLGPEGSLAVAGEREIRTPGFVVDVVDTTGAGDVFRGGFIAGWLRGGARAHLEEVLRYANAAAALKCRQPGGRDGIPDHAAVEALLG